MEPWLGSGEDWMAPDPYSLLIKPMLAESRETPFDSLDHIYEPKWDGTRAICFLRERQRFQNRRVIFSEPRHPGLKVGTNEPASIDGERAAMWEGKPSFDKMRERVRPGTK